MNKFTYYSWDFQHEVEENDQYAENLTIEGPKGFIEVQDGEVDPIITIIGGSVDSDEPSYGVKLSLKDAEKLCTFLQKSINRLREGSTIEECRKLYAEMDLYDLSLIPFSNEGES